MSDLPTTRRFAPAAILSVVAGLAGPVGLLFGYWCLYRINASDGRLRGRFLAHLGIALGALTTVALLVGGVAIGINHLRAVSGRVECVNNLRLLGGAIQKYHDNHGDTYPTGAHGPAELSPERRLSFHAAVLPWLEQRPGVAVNYAAIAGKLDFQEPWDAPANNAARTTTIPTYACRDDVGLLPDVHGTTNYVGITGVGADAALLPKDDPRAGFFGYDRVVHHDAVRSDIKAGTSYLVIATETPIDNGPWVAAGRPTLRYVPLSGQAIAEQAACVIATAGWGDGLGSLCAVPLLSLSPPNDVKYIGPGRPFGGLHRGGANVLHVDGSVVFLSDGIDAEVFRNLTQLANDRLDLLEPK
jgi:prepilin-type processing-associated H-X9-DG protein